MSLAALLAASSLILLAALSLGPLARRLEVAVALVFLGVGVLLGVLSGTARGVVDPAHLETAGTIALILILADGGLRTGIGAVRRELTPVLVLGGLGTLATFGLAALAIHTVTDLGWRLALIAGAALSPTDPAAVFSALAARREPVRIATVLEGEAGFNDPVAIALVLTLVDAARQGHDARVGDVLWTMARQGVIGALTGIVLALVIDALVSPRGPSVQVPPSLVVGLGAFLAFGAAGVADGSGFLAVYLYGLVLSERLDTGREPVVALFDRLSSLAEVGLFVLLGVALLSVPLAGIWWDALAVAALLALVIRPLVAAPVLRACGFSARESAFGVWGGLKGAVPILLGSLALAHGVQGGTRLFALVGVAVVLSLLLQGLTLGRLARLLGV